MSLNQQEVIGQLALYVNDNNIMYFDSFGTERIPKDILKLIENKNTITNIYRIQAQDSIMCKYFCIGFYGFTLKDKRLLEYTNLISPNKYQKNDKIILKHFHFS